jgi:FkbM family methyltransferase
MVLLLTPDSKYVFEGRDRGGDPLGNENADLRVVKETWVENVYHIEPEDFQDSGVFIDIGANIGAVSVYVASFNKDLEVGQKPIKVFAYEPEPHNLELLSKNIKMNNVVSEIKIISKAVYPESPVMISNNGGNSNVLRKDEDSVEVKAVNLENVFSTNKITVCDVMKIDIEGAEYDVIEDASIEVLQKIKYLTLEFDGGHERQFGKMMTKLAEVFNLHVIGRPSTGGYIYGRKYNINE